MTCGSALTNISWPARGEISTNGMTADFFPFNLTLLGSAAIGKVGTVQTLIWPGNGRTFWQEKSHGKCSFEGTARQGKGATP